MDGGLSLVVSGCCAAAAVAVTVGLLFAEEVAAGSGGVDDGETAGLGAGLESESELESELGSWALATLLSSPVSNTVQVVSPPPIEALAITKGVSRVGRTFIVWVTLAACAALRVRGFATRYWQQIATPTI